MKSGVNTRVAVLMALCGMGSLASAAAPDEDINPNPSWDDQWPTLESDFLSDHVELTSETKFVKAGESYFSPDGRMIIFQAIPVPEEGTEPDQYYTMYVASFNRDDDGNIIGLNQPSAVSEPGSSNTCGWFHPVDPMKILFGTTTTVPSASDVAGFQRKSSKYLWQFPVEMEIVTGELSMSFTLTDDAMARAKALAEEDPTKTPEISVDDFVSVPKIGQTTKLWSRDGYDAEGSWSSDGRYIIYTQLEPGGNNGDIWIYDSTDDSHTPLVTNDGYDGGPFFSPDGRSICYRSDRHGDNLLQVFVATLEFDESGKVVGIEEEKQLTNNEHVNWCPFFTPDGKYLLYASSELSHANYEVYAIDATGDYPLDETPHLRITKSRGFDGLPAISSDGQWMIWTAQRGALIEGQDRPSSQIWGARIDLDAIDQAYKAQRKAMIEKKDAEAFENYTPGE
jgi:TolB protein